MTAMSNIFLFAACIIAVLQSFLLQALFKELVTMQSVFEVQMKPPEKYTMAAKKTYGLTRGTSLPAFSVEALDQNEPVTRDTLLGEESVILFLDLNSGEQISKIRTASIINFLAAKVSSQFYVVCNDTAEACSKFKHQQELDRMYAGRAVVCVDWNESVANAFRAYTRPSAMIVDEHGIVQKVGGLMQELKDPPETTVDLTQSGVTPDTSNQSAS